LYVCDDCLAQKYEPVFGIVRSRGRCESCGKERSCLDIPSRALTPKDGGDAALHATRATATSAPSPATSAPASVPTRVRAEALRAQVKRLQDEVRGAQNELGEIERRCTHAWTEAVSDPLHQEAYTIPGDPPGTMGSDWRPATHVPARTTPRWRRECRRCGVVQYTERAR
jgi:hypothetical protein